MDRITSRADAALFDIAASRRIERAAAAALPPHALMQRAGLAVARLAMALAPHARTVWIACGPGNNGGDGFEAAAQLQRRGFATVVTHVGDERRIPPDAQAACQRARDAGVAFSDTPPPHPSLAIDALLGIGSTRAPDGIMAAWLRQMHDEAAHVLSVDVPSGLDADTGRFAAGYEAPALDGHAGARRACLSLLTLKPGLWTADGRDACGEVWSDDLGVDPGIERPTARLIGAPAATSRPHASHKGSFGDVAVVGGARGMTGAALLAASAALHAGAGRVFVAPLDRQAPALDVVRPELMFRALEKLDMSGMTVVCGCGGGSVVRQALPMVIDAAAALVLDADALNAIAVDDGLQARLRSRSRSGRRTVITPHPLEAARLLGVMTSDIQSDRLCAATQLSDRFGVVVVLKGSGTVIAGADEISCINASGNARLATAGTGDVLAGMIGAALAAGEAGMAAARRAVWRHGDLADRWPSAVPLTAGALALGRAPVAPDAA